MSMHRFYMTCDGYGCGERTEQYRSFPTCFKCGDNFCPNCSEEGFDDPETGRCLCSKCYQDDLAENVA